jgi:NADPH:quinone reductase
MPSVPKTMQAAAIDRFGGPEVLVTHSLPVPVPEPHEVLIALHTAGVGSWDADMRAGWSPSGRTRFPLVLGTDGSGTVVEVGSSVSRFRPGDRVYSYSFDNPKGGFYAEYVAVAADRVAPVPDGLELKPAGAIPTTGLTALQGIGDALHMKSGETLTILGASGGVGTMAVQFARLRGARTLAAASGEDGMKLVRRLGALETVDGRSDDILTAIHRFSPKGADAILATFGGKLLDRAMGGLRQGGRLAYPNGIEPEPERRSGIEVIGYDAVAGSREFDELGRAVQATKLQVPIAAEYSLVEAARAHERLAAGHVLGKIVLRIR